jgi:hypothetical protein
VPIVLINISYAWDKAKDYHKKYVSDLIDNSLISTESPPLVSTPLKRLLEVHADDIAVGSPSHLRDVIIFARKLLASATEEEKKCFKTEASRIFDYNKFANKLTVGWNAYNLCKTSTCTLCPYCQQAFAFTIQRELDGKSFRPTLDHFYPKHEYPYLALSLYNLVPSCYICNSSLKGKADFHNEQHLHPFEDNEMIGFELATDTYLEKRIKGRGALDISIVFKGGCNTKAKNSVTTFLLDERYELNEGLLRNFLDVVTAWNPERVEEVNQKVFESTVLKLTEVLVLGFDRNNYRNELLGKVKAELYDACWREI